MPHIFRRCNFSGNGGPGGAVIIAKKPIHFFRCLRDELPIPPHDHRGILQVPQHRPGADCGDQVRLKQERGDNSEVSPSAAHCPEQIVVLLRTGNHNSSVRQHHVDREQIVNRKPIFPGQVTHTSAQGQTGNPRRRDDAGRDRQAVSVGCTVHVGPPATRAHPNRVRCGIHSHVSDWRQVDHQTVVADAQTGGVMAAAPNRNPQAVGFRHSHRGDHVGDVGALSNQRRFAIDHGVRDLSRSLIPRVSWFEHAPTELVEIRQSFLVQASLCSSLRCRTRASSPASCDSHCPRGRSKSVPLRWMRPYLPDRIDNFL